MVKEVIVKVKSVKVGDVEIEEQKINGWAVCGPDDYDFHVVAFFATEADADLFIAQVIRADEDRNHLDYISLPAVAARLLVANHANDDEGKAALARAFGGEWK